MDDELCKRGHIRLPENVDINGRCRECHREGVRSWKRRHKARVAQYNRAYQAAHPEKHHQWERNHPIEAKIAAHRRDVRRYEKNWMNRLWTIYRLRPDDFERQMILQNRECPCGFHFTYEKGSRPCVDHDHACCPTEKCCGRCTRGFLCHRCNIVLGLYENKGQIYLLPEYLKKYLHVKGNVKCCLL